MKVNPFSNKSACLITDELTGKYLTNCSLEEGYLILADDMTCFIDARAFYGAKDKLEALGINVKLLNDLEDLKIFLNEIKVNEVYLDFSRVTVKQYNQIKAFGFEIKDCDEILAQIRAIKNQGEIENVQKACEIAQEALYKALERLTLGMTEVDLREIIERNILDLGGEGSSFDIIVAFGKNGAIPHHKTGLDRLEDNTPILIDMGAKYNGYCSDITRTVYFGNPNEKFVKYYDAVLRANLQAEKSIKCGTTTDVADGFAREYLEKMGMGELFTHSLGHGIGLEIHEYPTLSYKKKEQLKENMIFTIEPGVYLKGEFGIRIEDTVLLTKEGVKRLFTDSKELKIIKK